MKDELIKTYKKQVETLKSAVLVYQFGVEKKCPKCGSNGINFDVKSISWICQECDEDNYNEE